MAYLYLTLMLAFTLANTCALLFYFRKQKNSYMFLVFVAMVVSCFGHWLLGFSTTVEEANIANKVNYVGAAFFPMLMFFVMAQVSKVRIHSAVRITMFLLCCTVLGLAMTVGYSPVYYKTFEYVVQSGVGNYVATYGWGHDVFNFAVVLFGTLDVVVVAYALFLRKSVSLKNIAAMFLTEMVTFSSFILSRFFENDMLVMPFVYVLNQVILLFICSSVKWYDIVACVQKFSEEDTMLAFVSFAKDGRYLSANSNGEKFFPELKSCRVDKPIADVETMGALFNPLIRRMNDGEGDMLLDFWHGEKHFKVIVKTVKIWGFSEIYLFKIEDDTDIQLYVESLDKNQSELTELIKKNAHVVKTIQEQMIVGMANMVESRDGNTGGHIKRTSHVVKILADKMRKDPDLSLSDEFYDALISAAPMHDLGKIAIDDHILCKPGKFTDEELSIMRTHAEKGADIVENLLSKMEETPFFVKLSKNVAYYHHEWWNGRGYPCGLAGENIPIEARIMAVADVYDALVSRRCYKDRFSFSDAYGIIESSMGIQFDPSLKKYFEACNERLKEYYLAVSH